MDAYRVRAEQQFIFCTQSTETMPVITLIFYHSVALCAKWSETATRSTNVQSRLQALDTAFVNGKAILTNSQKPFFPLQSTVLNPNNQANQLLSNALTASSPFAPLLTAKSATTNPSLQISAAHSTLFVLGSSHIHTARSSTETNVP